jgi:hypothetical protein
MTIELLTKEEYELLLKIQKEHPILTFQNKGYEYVDKSKFSNEDKDAFDKVTEILKRCIHGFVEFNNFKLHKYNNKPQVRFQYDWTYDDNSPNKIGFTGVGYLFLDELLNGFKKK